MPMKTYHSQRDFKATLGGFDINRIKRLAASRGVDLMDFDPASEQAQEWKRKRDERMQAQAMAALANRTRRQIWEQGTNGRKHADFVFKQWDINKQPNAILAKKVATQVYLLAEKLKSSQTGFNIVLKGTRGTGKTSLATATMNKLKNAGKSCIFVETAELANLLEQRMGNRFGADERLEKRLASIEKAMKEADVLVLDDLGIEGGMADKTRPVIKPMQDMLYRVFNSRYDAKNYKVGIVTTNDTKERLSRKYSPQIVSRLLNVPADNVVKFDGLQDVRNF